MRFSKILLSSLLIISLVSCEETTTIGSSIIEDEIEIVMDSSYIVTGKSVENNRVQSRSLTQLLGIIEAKEYGYLKSDIVTQLMPTGKIDTTGVTVNDIDSLKLKMYIPMGGYTGDSIVPMGVNVYRLKQNSSLPSPIYSNFDPSDYYDNSDLIGSTIYSANALGLSDSIAELTHRFIEVKLPVELGRDFFTKYKENPNIYLNPTAFAKWFPGLYIANNFGSGRIMKISAAEVKMYYRKTVKIEDTNRDTTYYKEGNYFAITPEVISNNNITLAMSDNIKSMSENEAVIVAPAGMDVQITFPAREIIESYNNNKGNISVINALSFEIPAEEITNSNGITPPPYLLLVQSSKKDEFFENGDITDDKASFYATYDATNKKYIFSEMRQYLIDLLKKESVTDDDVTFTLTPVSLSTESSGSNYYYSSTTYINDITPYVEAPAMVKLNLDKAKIKFTYSKQTITN